MSKLTLGYPICKWPDEKTRIAFEVRRTVARRRSPHEKGYTWSLGYNHISGRFSQPGQYPELQGSSYNRSKKKKYEIRARTDFERQAHRRLARMVAAKMLGKRKFQVCGSDFNKLKRPSAEASRNYRLWLRSKISGGTYGIRMLSARSRGKIKDKATAFYRSCPGSRVFVTLTFISAVPDHLAVSILNKFLTVIRKQMPGFDYLWVAERQENNVEYERNIHFHMICNRRLAVKRFNALWVLQQYSAGLTGKSRCGVPISRDEIDRRYREGTIGKVLNPFDVKRVYGINGLSSYLTKYITKQEKGVYFGCLPWHCSRRVSRLFTRSTVSYSAFNYCRSFRNGKVDKQTGEIFDPIVINGYYFMMVYVNNKAGVLHYLKKMETVNKWIIGGWQLDDLPMIDDDLYRKRFCSEN